MDKRFTVQMSPYLSFKGDCEAAFTFYEQSLGGQRGAIFRYSGSPLASDVPADWSEKVMHGISLSLQIESAADAERIFHELANDGRVVVPLEQTFWAVRFGMVVDRFGIPWLINCGGADQPPEA